MDEYLLNMQLQCGKPAILHRIFRFKNIEYNQTVMKNIVYPILEMMLQYNWSPFIGEHCMRIAYSFSVTTFQIHKVWGMLSEKKYFIISLGRMYIFSWRKISFKGYALLRICSLCTLYRIFLQSFTNECQIMLYY